MISRRDTLVVTCLLHLCLISHAIAEILEEQMFTRYDSDAYLAFANRGGTVHNEGAPKNTRRRWNKDQPRYPQSMSSDDPNRCTTYLAPSSIPNSGLGMYTTVPYKSGELFLLPEIGILLEDRDKDLRNSDGSEKLLSSYPWMSSVLNLGKLEVGYGESMVPGLGMLANSHLGLWNMLHWDAHETQRWMDGTDSHDMTESSTLDDVGRGAHTHHTNVRFVAEKNIVEGEELFVNYGDAWFVAREAYLGIVPGTDHYVAANEMLQKFTTERDAQIDSWAVVDAPNDFEMYDRLLADALHKDKRLRAALPNNMEDVPKAMDMGAARFSARESIRSFEWLEENGACIDNIIVGTSTLPQAGRGAFATRSIPNGSLITTTPVITIEREELYIWENVEKTKEEVESTSELDVALELAGHQLLLNYCYGHVNSSLLFYPYSPSVNFINHGGRGVSNARIRWSAHPYHKLEWLNSTLGEMKSRKFTGLMFDIVATRDIVRGEEILLYYGNDWVESWKNHVEEWINSSGEDLIGDADLRFEIGTIVSKEFYIEDEGMERPFSGTVTAYKPVEMLYVVKFEDGEYENMSEAELEYIVVDQPPHSNVMTDRLGVPTVSDFNMVEKYPIVLTIDEQREEPYPRHIMNVCQFTPSYDVNDPPEDCGENNVMTEDGQCRYRWKNSHDSFHTYRCTITSRQSIDGLDWYTALVEVKPDTNPPTSPRIHLVEYMPRSAVLFADKPYTKDQYATGVFRHEVGLPAGLIPQHWMDLEVTDENFE